MNRIKKDLEDELQSITLSENKKKEIIQKMRVKNKKRKRESWSYRFVLTAFTLLALSFSYLLFTGDVGNLNHTEQPEISEAPSLFATDQSRMLLMIGIFIALYILLKIVFKRQGRTFPACANCGEEWSFRQSFKVDMLGEKSMKCPHCLQQQVKSDKATWEINLLNFLIPIGIVFSQLFDRVFIGYLIYAVCAFLMMALLSPYLLSFEDGEKVSEELSRKEKRWKVVQIIVPFVIALAVGWSFWEKSSSYPEPQEAVAEMFYDTTLIPAYSMNKQALFFSVMDGRLFSAHYVKKGIFGWKAKNAVTSYSIDYRNMTTNNYGESFGGTYLVYGLIEGREGAVVQVGEEEATLLNLEMLPAEEVKKLPLEGLAIWYFEREDRIDVTEEEVKLVDKKTGEVLEVLTFY